MKTIPDSFTEFSIALWSSEKLFDYRNPNLKNISIWNIARSLSNICRFGGHCEFYSVAEHSVLVAELAKLNNESIEIQMACLMHDAQECLIGDVVNPMKRFFPAIKEYETAELVPLFEKRFNLKSENWPIVKQYDFEAFKIESHNIFPGAEWLPEASKWKRNLKYLLPNDARELFQNEYLKLHFELHNEN